MVENSNFNYSDKTYIRFLDDATVGLDKAWDAFKLISLTPGVPQIYTTYGTIKLSINAQPETSSIPVFFESSGSGTFNISAVEVNDLTDGLLYDLFTGELTDLLSSPSYTFNHTNGSPAERFILFFSPVVTNELEVSKSDLWSNENNIYINAPLSSKGDITIYNMLGKEIVHEGLVPGLNVISMDNVSAFYLVKIQSSEGTLIRKLFVR